MRLDDLRLEPRDFLRQPFAFGNRIDFDVQHQSIVADNFDRRIGGRQVGHDLDLR